MRPAWRCPRDRRARRRARAAPAGCRAAIDDAHDHAAPPRPHRARAHDTGCPPECLRAFSSTFTNARSSCAGSALTSGSSRSIDRLKSPLPRAELVQRRAISSSTEIQSRRGSAAPASSRERSSRLSTRRDEPAGLFLDHGGHLRALLGETDGRQSPRPPPRSPSAASAGRARPRQQRRLDDVSAAQRRCLDHPAEQRLALQRSAQQRLERGTTRSCSRAQRPRGVRADQQRAEPAWCRRAAGTPRGASSASTASISIAAEASSSVCASRAAAVGSASARLFPRSSSRAISAARSASRRRSCASRARARVSSARSSKRRHDQERSSATQFLESAIVKPPDGRQMEVVERRSAQDRCREPEPHAPHDRDDQYRRQVHDASDATGATCLSG